MKVTLTGNDLNSKANTEYNTMESDYTSLLNHVQNYYSSLVRNVVAVETKKFITLSDELKQQLESVDITDTKATDEFVSKLLSFHDLFKDSSINRYMDEKSEIRACIVRRMEYIATNFCSRFSEFINAALSKLNYPVTDYEANSTEDNSDIFRMRDEDAAVIILLLRDYMNYVSQISAAIPISTSTGSFTSDSTLIDVLRVLLNPIRVRFEFHFILYESTSSISATPVYMNYILSFLHHNLPFILQICTALIPEIDVTRVINLICGEITNLMQTRLMLDLNCIIENKISLPESNDGSTVEDRGFDLFQGILNEVMKFDDALRNQWGIQDEKIFLMNCFTSDIIFKYWYSGDLQVLRSTIADSVDDNSTRFQLILGTAEKKITHIPSVADQAVYFAQVIIPILEDYYMAINPVSFDYRTSLLVFPWSDITRALHSIDVFNNGIENLMNSEKLYPLFDEEAVQPFMNYPNRMRKFKHEMYDNICSKCQRYYEKHVLDEVMTIEHYTLAEPNYSVMEQIVRYVNIGKETLESFRTELEEAISSPVVCHGILFRILSMIDREVKERVLRLHYNTIGKEYLVNTLTQIYDLRSVRNEEKRNPMRFCGDLIHLFSLTESQTNALLARIDDNDKHDDAYYAQYLNTVNIDYLTSSEVIDILNNSM